MSAKNLEFCKSNVNYTEAAMVHSEHRTIINYNKFLDREDKSSDMIDESERDFNVSCSVQEENKTGLKLALSSVENQGCEINPDYQILPKTFFKYDNIPPPLVNKNWLKSVRSFSNSKSDEEQITDDSCEEDTMPLSRLKHDIILLNETTCEIKLKPSTTIIQRKRGRPRKERLVENGNSENPSNLETDFLNNDENYGDNLNDAKDADWWTKNFDINSPSAWEVKNELVGDEGTLGVLSNHEASDNFEAAEEGNNMNKKSRGKKIKKKYEDIQGMKVENSKVIYPCQECGKTFSAASTLKYHLRIHNGTLIKCRECDRGFTTNYLLKCHMRIHNGDLFMCQKCGRGFTTAELLKVHNRSHTGVRPYVCDICMKAFPSASNLTQHKGIHQPEKKYLCFQCGSSFSQKRCLDGHMLSHGEKNHICTVCGKLWARKSDLTEHMRVHTGYKPYSCNSCSQKFTQASSLRRHQIVHMDTKPIKCSTCGKMLKCDEYYKRHMKKHMKKKEQEIS